MSQEVGYFEAWNLWWNSAEIKNHYLYGLEILWWGRIGKVVQLLSAVSILAEIIGHEKLRYTATLFTINNYKTIPFSKWFFNNSR